MSSSPSICASPNFTFPNTNSPRDTPVDYFTMKSEPKPSAFPQYNQPSPAPQTRLIPNHHSHSLSHVHPKPHSHSASQDSHKAKLGSIHKSINSSISSITSNTSDLTIYENSFSGSLRNDSIVSTDTLVDEEYPEKQNSDQCSLERSDRKTQKSNHHLKLNVPRRSNKSLSASSNDFIRPQTLLTCSESEELDSQKASSATESSFPFHSPVSGASSHLSADHVRQPAPLIKKQTTLPSIALQHELSYDSIKHEQLKRLHSLPTVNYKSQIENLSNDTIKYISAKEANEFLTSSTETKLIIDIRPFADYVKSHIKDALNVCLPSTLLKRPNFNLHRCINSLPNYEKSQFKNLFSSKNGKVLIYDYFENSANLYHICNKFVNSPLFIDSHHLIYLVDSNFIQVNSQYPNLFEEGNVNPPEVTSTFESKTVFKNSSTMNSSLRPAPTTLQNPSSTSNINTRTSSEGSVNNILAPLVVNARAQSLADLSSFKKSGNELKRNSSTSFDFDNIPSSTPILSKFLLPKITAGSVFKIRHNEELGDLKSNPFDSAPNSSVPLTLSENSSKLFKFHNIPADISGLPQWLKSTAFVGQEQSNKINDDFYALEKYEQKRLISALSLQNSTNGITSPMHEGETAPLISCGIEYGHKNRYKDIFLFEHSRVKLTNEDARSGELVASDEDYINASYVDPIQNLKDYTDVSPKFLSHLKFIATQGPLEQTMGDFWKCIIKSRSPIVMSLTDEVENGVMKCSPFWKSGIYRSNQDVINLKLTSEVKTNSHLFLRSFAMTMTNQDTGVSVSHSVFQIHLLSWPDMGTISSPLDIIQLIQLKYYMLEKLNIHEDCKYPTVIHCSAGCGRTGTLGAIDTVINILKNNQSQELNSDPVQKIVNNFRKQRISMVQNLRQYYLIYDIILSYLNVDSTDKEAAASRLRWDDLTKLDVVDKFILNYTNY